MPVGLLPQDRLVAKEVALGVIREFVPPENHIGLATIAPFKNVESDDAIFTYTRGLTAGLAPARAEDAESELAQKDDSVGTGRASVIDWAIKDHYDPSDVTRFRDALVISDNNSLPQFTSLPFFVSSILDSFQERVARDRLIRSTKLFNRMEWLIMTALQDGYISYNDGKIVFSVNFARPAAQSYYQASSTLANAVNSGSAGGLATPPSGHYWNSTSADPIADLLELQDYMYNTTGVRLQRGIISRRILHAALTTTKFQNAIIGNFPLYTVSGFNYQAALDVIAQKAEINFELYDSVYRTRAIGSNTMTNNRFTDPHVLTLLPSPQDLAALDDSIGFAKTLTSPHAEGNWTAGFYEWEKETVDPWSHDLGTGIKAFPVFPHLNLSATMQVLDPAYTDPITGTTPGLTYTMPPY